MRVASVAPPAAMVASTQSAGRCVDTASTMDAAIRSKLTAALPDRFIHKPWMASPLELAEAKVTLGKTYPEPVVDHDLARKRALAAFERTKG